MVAINNIIAFTSVAAVASAAALPEANWWYPNKPFPTHGSKPSWGPQPTKSHPSWGPSSEAPFPTSNGTFPHHSEGHAQPTGHHSFVLPTQSWPTCFPTEWPTQFSGAFPTGWPTTVPSDIADIESIIDSIWSEITAAPESDEAAPTDGAESDFFYASSATLTF